MIGHLIAFGSGLLFAIGLALGGMTTPENVIRFLDPFDWNPALAFVMVGAIGVYATAVAFGRRMSKPVIARAFSIVTRGSIDRRLILGSLLFGAGWGLAGYCPGPALAATATLAKEPLAFAAAMLIAFWTTRYVEGRLHQRSAP